MKPVSMLIIGAANPHVRNYYNVFIETKMLNLLAISEADNKRLDYARIFFSKTNKSIKFYSDWENMLDEYPKAESVMVGMDNFYHYEIIKEAIKRKKHIYSMKVISMNEKECEEIISLCRENNLKLQVELELHFNPQYKHVRDAVKSGKLGEIKSIYVTNISQCPCTYFPNWCDPVLSYGRRVPIRPGAEIFRGGALTDHPHPFDLIYWITGKEIKRIFAVSGKNQRDWSIVEDHVAITGELEAGIKFFINPSYSHIEENVPTRRLYWPKSLEVAVKITGTKGYMAVDFFDKHIYVMSKNHISSNRLIVDGVSKMILRGENLLESFALAVRGEREIESSGEDGLRAIKAMNAAYESIATDSVVELK